MSNERQAINKAVPAVKRKRGGGNASSTSSAIESLRHKRRRFATKVFTFFTMFFVCMYVCILFSINRHWNWLESNHYDDDKEMSTMKTMKTMMMIVKLQNHLVSCSFVYCCLCLVLVNMKLFADDEAAAGDDDDDADGRRPRAKRTRK